LIGPPKAAHAGLLRKLVLFAKESRVHMDGYSNPSHVQHA